MNSRLWTEHQVEVPVLRGQDQPLVRVSVQAYNTPDHLERLVEALKALLS